MAGRVSVRAICAGLAGLSLCVSSPAAAAAQSSAALNPWVALTAFSGSSSSAALCANAASAAASSAAQGAAPGCVLPAVDVPPPVAEAPPAPVPAPVVPASQGIGALPILLGLAALAGLAALLLSGGDGDDDEINVPVSP